MLKRILALAVLAVACALAMAQGEASQPIILRGKITSADLHTYRLVPFQVPAGTRRLTIVFAHNGRDQRTVIDLGLFDPQSFRGWSGSDKEWFTVSEVDATASYLPGALPAGEWQLLLGVPNIRPNVATEYTATIYLSKSLDLPSVAPVTPAPLRQGPGWFQGELHAHTEHSDGNCATMAGGKTPCPEFKLLEKAAALGLDFLAVTDHNTLSHYNALRQWQGYFDKLLLIRGRELTTFFGHANMYGTSSFVDFRVAPGFTATDMARQAHARGALFSINHPTRPSGEICMGCGWNPTPPVDYAQVDAIEAVNGIDADSIYSGIPFWEARLNDGHRVTAIGGSDDHKLPAEPSALAGAVATPTTVVYARELSERAILEGIKAGHVFLKLHGGPAAPNVLFTAASGASRAMMGDNLHARAGERIAFNVEVKGAANARLEVIRDGKVAPLLEQSQITADKQEVSFPVISDGARHWYRLNLRAADGTLLVLTNPIYENFPD